MHTSVHFLDFSYDHPHIIAGQGTAGLEIVEQVPDVDAVVIQTGGGSLMAGNALAIKHYNPNIKVIVRNAVYSFDTIEKYSLFCFTYRV